MSMKGLKRFDNDGETGYKYKGYCIGKHYWWKNYYHWQVWKEGASQYVKVPDLFTSIDEAKKFIDSEE